MSAAIDALAAEFAPDLLAKALLDSILWDETSTLMPGTEWRDNHLWLTVPARIPAERKLGRGKNAETETYIKHTTLLLRDDYFVCEYTRENIEKLGYEFPPVYSHELNPRWSRTDMRDFLTNRTGSPKGADIHRDLRSVYMEYIEFADPIFYELLPLYIMASYVFRIFNSIGYLHFNGTAASGKTQNLKLLQAFSLNTQLVSSISQSALFRSIASSPGLLCLDEAETFSTEQGQELSKLLRSGYQRGGSVRRTERMPDDAFMPVEYPVYSPKAIASINVHDPVLTSRCIVVPMMPALRRIAEFNAENPAWQTIRDQLYRWALIHGPDVAMAEREWNTTKRHEAVPDLMARQWQVSQQYFIVADAIGRGDLIAPMTTFFGTYYAKQQALVNDTDRLRLVLRSLPEVIRTKAPGYGEDYYALKEIHEVISNHLESDDLEYFKSRNASKMLRTLDFTETRQTRGGLHFRLNRQIVKEKLEHRQIEPFEDDINWFNEATVERPLRDETLDWLQNYDTPEE